jgi:four helix bundle protein
MENPKSQIPNPKKIPSTKLQKDLPIPSSLEWWEGSEPADGLMTLHDGPDQLANGRTYDLEERTAQFGEAIIRFSKKVPRDPSNNRLIDQIVGCGTSVGANYHEANEPVSKKDFRFCISRCLKEAKETKFFLRMIAAAEPKLAEEARSLYREAKELVLIFSSMYRK